MFKKSQFVTMGALVGIGLFNPASVEILEPYFKMVYTAVFLACVVWVVSFMLIKAFKPEKIKTAPKKKAKHNMKYEVTA